MHLNLFASRRVFFGAGLCLSLLAAMLAGAASSRADDPPQPAAEPASAPSAGEAARSAAAAEWKRYRERFVADDGRVLDTGNKQISHTEGQGWAMLFAETFDDRATFEKVWSWTRTSLQRPDSALFAWKWEPEQEAHLPDRNNASDGDILIAWALARAALHWHDPQYGNAAKRIAADIRRLLMRVDQGRLLLLPGREGFRTKERVVVNPSYYVFPAIKALSRLDPSPEWQRLRRQGLTLLAEARFGRWGLPADWVALGSEGDLAPAEGFPARFGFDAVRIPLYLIWSGEATPERLASYLDFWNSFGARGPPGWADVSDNSVAPWTGPTGFRAIAALARSYRDASPAALPSVADGDDYYSSSLTLLARIAQRETIR